jgi:hypothetical protein
MARGRIIDNAISHSKKVSSLKDATALLYVLLITHTDDFGRMEGDAEDVLHMVVPRRGYSISKVEEMLTELTSAGLIEIYQIGHKTYLEILNFERFQTFRSDRPRRAEYPDKTGLVYHGQPMDDSDSHKISKVKGRKVNIHRHSRNFGNYIRRK